MKSIIVKDIKQSFRNRKSLILMILFPLVLMWILSSVFAGQFDSSSLNFRGVTVIYSADEESSLGLLPGFNSFTAELTKMNINFLKVANKQEAITQIEDSNYVCYIELNKRDNQITIYKNDRHNSTASFIEGLIATFVQRYNLIYQITEANPSAVNGIINKQISNNYVDLVSLEKGESVRSIDYYGITMLTLIIMYSINTGMDSISREQNIKTGDRILETPIAKYKLFLGKVISAFLVTMLQMSVVILFSIKVLGVNWGSDIPTVLLIVVSQIFMCVSVGFGVAFLVKNQEAGDGIISIGIPVLIFLGGGYYPLERIGSGLINSISNISPVKWINKSIFEVIHLQNYSYVGIAILINITIALSMLFISSLAFNKREEL